MEEKVFFKGNVRSRSEVREAWRLQVLSPKDILFIQEIQQVLKEHGLDEDLITSILQRIFD